MWWKDNVEMQLYTELYKVSTLGPSLMHLLFWNILTTARKVLSGSMHSHG